MNCKPGDLAVVCRASNDPLDQQVLGAIRRVTRVWKEDGFGPLWDYEGERLYAVDSWGWRRQVLRLADSCLRPISDPGEDATDETLEWAPVPRVAETMP